MPNSAIDHFCFVTPTTTTTMKRRILVNIKRELVALICLQYRFAATG